MAKKEIKVTVYQGDNELTVEKAKEIIGWQVAGDGQPADWDGKDATFRVKLPGDKKTTPVKLINSRDNRPIRMALVGRYKNKMLSGQWAGLSNCKKYSTCNGESMGVDENNQATSMQHRLVAFILAEAARKHNPETHGKKPLTMQAIVVEGIDPQAADTVDLGQNRTTSDVLFRRHEFAGNYTDGEKKKLSNILAGAARLAWIRSSGRSVSSASKFEHEDMLEFVEENPRLHDAVETVFGHDFAKRITPAYAAGLLYLAGTSTSIVEHDGNEFQRVLDYENFDKAIEFWESFATGADLEKDSPILALRNFLDTVDAGSAEDRDIIVIAATRAFNLWLAGEKASTKDIRPKMKNVDTGQLDEKDKPIKVRKLCDDERHGGIDLAQETLQDMLPATPAENAAPVMVGQKVKVNDPELGEVEVEVSEVFGQSFNAEYPDDGGIWEVTFDMLAA